MGHEHVVVRAEDTMVLQAAQYGISEKMARQVLGVTEPDIVFEDELESSEDEARGGTRCAHVRALPAAKGAWAAQCVRPHTTSAIAAPLPAH